MKRLPRLTLGLPSVSQKERLVRWMTDWEIDRHLPGAGAERERVTKATHDPLVPRHESEDLPVHVGQIRLLPPSIPVARNRLIYVVVLDGAGHGPFFAVPFSRFSEPCFPGELLTCRLAPGLKSLCLWNGVTVTGALLKNSWVVDVFSPGELEETLSVLKCLRTGARPPPVLAGRLGPPLWHPSDPRRVYLREEALLAEALSGMDPGATGLADAGTSPWPDEAGRSPLFRAAEDHDEYKV